MRKHAAEEALPTKLTDEYRYPSKGSYWTEHLPTPVPCARCGKPTRDFLRSCKPVDSDRICRTCW